MKLLVVIFCLVISVSAFGQTRDTRSTRNPTEPLIMLDGVPYSGIPNPGDIKGISLLEGKDATPLYGSQAALGVIFVTTKNNKGYYIRNNPDKTNDLFIDTNALYIIDGKVSSNKLKGIDLKNILSVDILKYTAKDPSLNNGINREVIIVTKQGAIKAYQKKLSAFSKGYEDYLLANRNDDEGLWYIIDGLSTKYGVDQISKLYALKKEKIKSVDFGKHIPDDAGFTGRVIIKTKK